VWSLVSVCASAQTSQQTLQSLQAKNPPGVVLKLSIQGQRFHEGEIIPFDLDTPPRDPARQRLYRFPAFLLSPAADCGTLSTPCFDREPGGGGGGGLRMKTELNAYLGALKPGHYRVAALFSPEVLKPTGPSMYAYSYTDPREYIVSNAVEFEIVPADLGWQRRTIAAAVKVLIQGDAYEPVQMRQEAARQLSYLQTPLAWEAEVEQLDKSEGEIWSILVRAQDKKAVCGILRARLLLPAQYVSGAYLRELGTLCGEGDPDAALLAAHFHEKTTAFQGAALDGLLQYAAVSPTPPDWLPALRQEAIREFPQISAERQRAYLAWEWAVMRVPEMAPVLDSYLSRAGTGDPEGWRLAIRRLNEFAPAQAQARIVADILQPVSRVDDDTLALLPPEATRGLTPKLIQTLATAQKGPAGNPFLAARLIARYGDAASLPRIKAIFESQPDKCQPELFAYFLRVDPAYAGRILHRQPWDMHAPAPVCATHYFAVTARIFMSPELESFIAAYTMHGDVQVKMAAAESLGTYGTAAAEQPLWDTLQYFHDYWKDRPALLQQNVEGEYLEVALRNAIARGNGWLANAADLARIASLCISERCQHETANDLHNMQQPLGVQVEGGSFRVAQYTNIASLEALEKKLAQFPPGTTFRLHVSSPGRGEIVQRLQQFGAGKGLTFQLPSN